MRCVNDRLGTSVPTASNTELSSMLKAKRCPIARQSLGRYRCDNSRVDYAVLVQSGIQCLR